MESPAIVSFRFPDLGAARDFYVDQLGFGDGYNQAIATRRGHPGPNSVYIEAVELDDLYQRCRDQRIKIVDPIGERVWGQSEFTIEDPAGNFLSFWRALE